MILLKIFPTLDLGKSSTNETCLGHLYKVSFSLQYSTISLSVNDSLFFTTTAFTASVVFLSGTPITPTSKTFGCEDITCSTSFGKNSCKSYRIR